MNYFSCFSGIEAASEAWRPLGWKPIGFSEIDPFASQVLAQRHPGVTNYGDITKHEQWLIKPRIDLIVGGSPCQSFSTAGLRKGLEDPRGNLMLTYLAFIKSRKPKWVIYENVPGILSSNGGRDFASLLQGLEICGYKCAWRILDAQFFGVPQRRKRVWLVGYFGNIEPATKVLFEQESLSGNIESRRNSQKDASSTLENGIRIVGALDTQCGADKLSHQSCNAGHIFVDSTSLPFVKVQPSLLARDSRGIDNYATEVGGKIVLHKDASDVWPQEILPLAIPYVAWNSGAKANFGWDVCENVSPTLCARGPNAVGFQTSQLRKQGKIDLRNVAPTLLADTGSGDNETKVLQVFENHPNSSRVTGPVDVCPTITARCGTGGGNVPFALSSFNSNGLKNGNPNAGCAKETNIAKTIDASIPNPAKHQGGVAIVSPTLTQCKGSKGGCSDEAIAEITAIQSATNSFAIRRLTVTECERLQGFSDNYTKISYNNKPDDKCPDSHRYKALGNSMAVPCIAWLGKRIDNVHKIYNWMSQ